MITEIIKCINPMQTIIANVVAEANADQVTIFSTLLEKKEFLSSVSQSYAHAGIERIRPQVKTANSKSKIVNRSEYMGVPSCDKKLWQLDIRLLYTCQQKSMLCRKVSSFSISCIIFVVVSSLEYTKLIFPSEDIISSIR